MSKFLVQSKNFLPLVIQKSTTEGVQVLDRHPSLSTTQYSEEVSTAEPRKQDQIQKEDLKVVVSKNSEIPRIMAVQFARNRTLTEAFILDMKQIQRRLLEVSESQVKLLWRQLMRTLEQLMKGEMTVSRGPGSGLRASLVWIDGQPRPQPKETHPAPVILPEIQKKMEPQASQAKTDKSEGKIKNKIEKQSEGKPPITSKLWETIQEKSPDWQISISNHLGDLQKLVVEKFPK